MSVVGTQAMAIKKFIIQLECDAYILDKKFRNILYEDNSADYKDALKGNFFTINILTTYLYSGSVGIKAFAL